MKKHWKPLVLSVLLSCGQQVLATEAHTPNQILNAIFVSFQPVEVFTAEEISAARAAVVEYATMGDPEAVVVAKKFSQSPIQSGPVLASIRLSADPTFTLVSAN